MFKFVFVCFVVFFKQKTAYEMRISDWSSDVCSSDLHLRFLPVADCNMPMRAGCVRGGVIDFIQCFQNVPAIALDAVHIFVETQPLDGCRVPCLADIVPRFWVGAAERAVGIALAGRDPNAGECLGEVVREGHFTTSTRLCRRRSTRHRQGCHQYRRFVSAWTCRR